MTQYNNGALPDCLYGREFRSPREMKFALCAEDARAYLDWCDQQGLAVLGFDVWAMTEPQPYALPEHNEGGDSDHCRAAITTIEAEHAKEIVTRHGFAPVCNIQVEKPT